MESFTTKQLADNRIVTFYHGNSPTSKISEYQLVESYITKTLKERNPEYQFNNVEVRINFEGKSIWVIADVPQPARCMCHTWSAPIVCEACLHLAKQGYALIELMFINGIDPEMHHEDFAIIKEYFSFTKISNINLTVD